MSRILPAIALAALALGGCAGDDGNEAAAAADGANPAAFNAQAPGSAQDPVQLQARAAAAMAAILAEPEAARFANVRAGTSGAVCGEVSPRGRDGRYAPAVPFVVTPAGEARLSGAPTVRWNDPEDPFPELYAQWCATPEELRAIPGALGVAPPPPVAPVPELPLEDPFANAGEPEPSPVEPPRPAPQPRRTPPADDSFSNAVMRPEG